MEMKFNFRLILDVSKSAELALFLRHFRALRNCQIAMCGVQEWFVWADLRCAILNALEAGGDLNSEMYWVELNDELIVCHDEYGDHPVTCQSHSEFVRIFNWLVDLQVGLVKFIKEYDFESFSKVIDLGVPMTLFVGKHGPPESGVLARLFDLLQKPLIDFRNDIEGLEVVLNAELLKWVEAGVLIPFPIADLKRLFWIISMCRMNGIGVGVGGFGKDGIDVDLQDFQLYQKFGGRKLIC